MRQEYEIYQRLVWDGEFRRQFIVDKESALQQYYSNNQWDMDLFSDTATIYGLEEEAYRRLAALYRSSKQLFPNCHNILISFFGNSLFESVLQRYFDYRARVHYQKPDLGLEILDPFDGYIIGPMIIDLICNLQGDNTWIQVALHYEWAIWYAKRVASGWPPIKSTEPLVDGATLISANFDIKALLNEIKRLEESSVGTEVFRWRIKPSPGSYFGVIFPRDVDVVEARIDENIFNEFDSAISNSSFKLSKTVQKMANDIGLTCKN